MTIASVNWDNIDLVVFDVDGTLYNQKALRYRMLTELLAHTIATRSLAAVKVIRIYRTLREQLATQEVEDFDAVLVSETEKRLRLGAGEIQAIITEWMEIRPLKHIRSFRYPQLVELFQELRQRGKIIGVFSDYPAVEKLAAMGLPADYVVAAGDPDVRILKPNPRGLQKLIERANVIPTKTILVGDRVERDGEAAIRAGTTALIRSSRPMDGWLTFSDYSDPIFSPLLVPKIDLI